MTHQFLDHIHRQVVSPVLAAALAERVDGQLGNRLYACSLEVLLEVSEHIINHIPVTPLAWRYNRKLWMDG
jgi:hypothetical protein